jgi:hypothetical protein
MKAVVLNCTLKPAPEPSNTELLAQVVIDALAEPTSSPRWSGSSIATSCRGS